MRKPHWDKDTAVLTFGGVVVKRFRTPAKNQRAVLAAFEEEGWPKRISDPLVPKAEVVAKERLGDTIRSLNRFQQNPLIRFRGDGTGEGIYWERS